MKKKINIDRLSVKSFITTLEQKISGTIAGGEATGGCANPTGQEYPGCQNTEFRGGCIPKSILSCNK